MKYAVQLENGTLLVPIPQRENAGCVRCKMHLLDNQKYCWRCNQSKNLESLLPVWQGE